VALNILAYLPSQTFEEAEATEFTVTLALVVAFLIFSIIGLILTVKNRRDTGLIALSLVTMAFITLSYFRGAFQSQVRKTVDLSYAFAVLGIATARMLMIRRSIN
jgi:hypothetical protein